MKCKVFCIVPLCYYFFVVFSSFSFIIIVFHCYFVVTLSHSCWFVFFMLLLHHIVACPWLLHVICLWLFFSIAICLWLFPCIVVGLSLSCYWSILTQLLVLCHHPFTFLLSLCCYSFNLKHHAQPCTY
jgi:hypothetical protein